jgi:hypothetical protein
MQSQSLSRDLQLLDSNLERLSYAEPYVKKNVLLSCVHVTSADGQFIQTERELLRAISDSLGLPFPPLTQPSV